MVTTGKNLKVGLVLDDGLDKPDGVQQYILSLGHWLTSQGHEVHYLVGQTARRDLPHVHSLSRNLQVRSNGNRLSIPFLASRRELKQILAREQFDVLHVQTPYHPFMGGQLVRLAAPSTAVVGTFHILPNSRLITVGTYLLGLWCRRSLQRFDTMLSVSSAAGRFAEQTFHIASEVLPNVTDYQRFHKAQPLADYNDDVLTILFLGRLVPRKGASQLIEAVARLVRDQSAQLPRFRVLICGTGPEEGKLRHAIERNELQDIVVLTGFVTEEAKPQYYASADISVFPSRGGESFGIVLLEAMASGRAAVLAGDNPGYRSVMMPQPDLLFDPRDTAALVHKLAFLLMDAKRRQELAHWGADYTMQFDVATVGTQLLDIYQRALHKRRHL